MPGDAIAMLFAPPQPPVSLPREGEVVLGRSRECAVRLGDADTSRRHAKIMCSGGRFVLHDLGSTNGTFASGARGWEGRGADLARCGGGRGDRAWLRRGRGDACCPRASETGRWLAPAPRGAG